MNFLNYSEVDFSYLSSSVLRQISIKKNISFVNTRQIKMPNVQLFFSYKDEQQIDNFCLYDKFIFLFFLTGNKSILKNLKSKFIRGVTYWSFRIEAIIYDDFYKSKFFDFFFNSMMPLISEYVVVKNNFENGYIMLKIKNLDVFGNLRIVGNFYTPSIKDVLYLKIFFDKKDLLNIDFLKFFKIDNE